VAQTNEAFDYYNPTTVCDGGLCPARARFRVTINGFVNNRQTQDDPLQRDGKDDEVFLLSNAYLFKKDGEPHDHISPLRLPPDSAPKSLWKSPTVQSLLFGDTNNQPNPPRIRAGMASDLGGIRSGDRFPTNTPWQRGGAGLSSNRLPLLLWEGDLVQGQNGLVIVPTIWEWDGQPELLAQWQASLDGALNQFGGMVGGLLASPAQRATAPIVRDKIGVLNAATSTGFMQIDKTRFDARDRPIGMTESRDQYVSRYYFEPKVLVLTYESAQRAMTSANNWTSRDGVRASLGYGVMPITYTDDAGLDGSYTLFLQIERVP
jgi:hypothetical protein